MCTTVKYGKEDIIDALSDVSTSKVSHTFPNPLYQQQGSCQEYKSSTQEISNFQLPAHFSKRGNRIGGAVQSIIETLAFPKPVFLNSRSSISPISGFHKMNRLTLFTQNVVCLASLLCPMLIILRSLRGKSFIV